jgi:hypothetical protein
MSENHFTAPAVPANPIGSPPAYTRRPRDRRRLCACTVESGVRSRCSMQAPHEVHENRMVAREDARKFPDGSAERSRIRQPRLLG